MNAFLDSLRADLLGRLRLLLALLALALVGAIAYAAFAGAGSSTPSTSAASTSGTRGGIAVAPVKTEATEAIAETTNGGGAQTGGRTRNPFTPLPTPKAAASATSQASPSTPSASSSAGSASETSAGSSAPSGSSGGSSPPKPKTQKKKKSHAPAYEVSVLFGTVAPGTAPANAQLTPFERLTLQQPLPSSAQALIVYRGVVAGGKSVTFTLVGEAILRGEGACRPSTSQCQSIDLQKGQSEELEYAPPGATATNYLLQVVDVRKAKAHGARAHRARAHGASARAAIVGVGPVSVVDSEPQGLSASK